jgi:hypothetical protein
MSRLDRLRRLEQKAPDRSRDLSEWSDAELIEHILNTSDKSRVSDLPPVLATLVKDLIHKHSPDG